MHLAIHELQVVVVVVASAAVVRGARWRMHARGRRGCMPRMAPIPRPACRCIAPYSGPVNELFDLANDPYELTNRYNLTATTPVVKRLVDRLNAMLQVRARVQEGAEPPPATPC